MIRADLREHALAARGFMPAEEGDALHDAAIVAARECPGLPFVEVGSYCGRSSIWLGAAAQAMDTVLFAVDHHRGSLENQAGWEHHDTTVVDERTGLMDTLPLFRRAVHDAGLEAAVIAVVGHSPDVARRWRTPLAFLFVDGGHGEDPARADYEGWAPHVVLGGTFAIHDVFVDPAHGGQAPYEQIFLPAIESGQFRLRSEVGSLRILVRER
ncbi:MAG: class I SAM-dependent methyltransferase [Ilumatobacteraceae bacterium]